MMQIKDIPSDESGNVLVLVLALMVVLLGFTALVIDAGVAYLSKAKLVNAMDSAVLAGVQELPADPDKAVEVAEDYAVLNGVNRENVNFEVDDINRTISGTANRELGLFFANALGFQKVNLSAHAQAGIVPISGVTGIVPFGVLEQELTFGQIIILKEGGGDGTSGWFGALRLGGNGANVYRNNIKFNYQGALKIGDVIPVEPGNMSGPTSVGIAYRINQCDHVPGCSIDSYVEGCSRICIVPIVNIESQSSGGHVFTVKIVAFAAFFVADYVGHGNDNEVQGAFIEYVIPGETVSNAGDYGLYGAKLIE